MAIGDELKKGALDLAQKSLDQNNLLSDLEGIYGTDLTEQELAAGIKPTAEAASTPTYAIPEFDRYRAASRNYGALPSMYQLYLSGGFPEETTDPVQEFIGGETIDTGTGGGGGGGEGGSNIVDQLGTVDMGGVTGDPITVEDISMNQIPIASEHAGTISGAPEVFDIDETGDPALNMPVDDGMVAGPFDYIQQPAIDAERLAGYNTQDPTLGDRIKSAWTSGKNIATEFGQDIEDKLNDLKDRGIDIGRMAGSTIMNMIAPGLGFVAQALPPYEPTFTERTLEEEIGVTEEGKFSGDPTKSAFAELNAVSAFGDPVETAKDRIDTRLENIENKDYKPGDEFYDDTQTMIDEYDRVTNKLGDIDIDTTGDAQIAEETIGTLPEITEARQETAAQIQEIQQQEAVTSGSNEARDQQRDTGAAKVETAHGTRYETSSGDTYASAAEAAEKGDGGGGGGKIVCTMMNESYGFGSFRNKIWLRQSKNLAPEYQKGYHKIFLPLVKLSKKNIVLKKVLEHIAIHRTIDIRQEARGKTHLLGRIYRKILEPICYWAGKNA